MMQPTRDRLIVKETVVEEKTSRGFVIVADDKETTTTGQVVAVGPGAKNKDGVVLPMTVSVGNQILFPKNTGHKIKTNGEEHIILSEADVLAVLDQA